MIEWVARLNWCKILKIIISSLSCNSQNRVFNPYLKTSLIRLRMKRSLQSLISFFPVKIKCFNPYLKTSLIRLRMKRSLQSLISFFSGLGQIFVFCSRSQETYLLLRQKEQIGSSFENFFPYSCYYFLALGSCNIFKINFLLSKLFIDILLFFDK